MGPTVLPLGSALTKEGLRAVGAETNLGELYLADIGVPPRPYSGFFDIEVDAVFAQSDVIRLA